MCGIAEATLALSIASAAATAAAQDQAASAQAAANKQTYDSQMQAYNANIANANLAKQQEASATSAKIIENNAAARRDQSKALVSAGEAGVSGLSVGALLAELGGEAGRANTNAMANYEQRDRAIEMDRMNAWAGTTSNISALKSPQGADYIGAGLKIASAAYDYKNPRLRTTRI